MTFKTLMLHMDLEHSNDARLQIASELADMFGASTIGIAACDHTPPPYYLAGAYAQSLIEKDRANLVARMAELETLMRENMQTRRIEWRQSLSRPTEFVAAQARAADLIIAGTDKGGNVLDPFRHVDVSALVIQAGRPVFLVPPEAQRLSLKSALVAWKDTREARRAIQDALPLLRKMGEVCLAGIVEDDNERALKTRLADVAQWLERHGITAQPRVMQADEDTEETLECLASEVGADLIVAGAYGHSRFSEWIFGGVTRSLLTRSSRCCLLAH